MPLASSPVINGKCRTRFSAYRLIRFCAFMLSVFLLSHSGESQAQQPYPALFYDPTAVKSTIANPPAADERPEKTGGSWLCEAAINQAEKILHFPKHIMRAIALAESGKNSPAHGGMIAWPWTVTSGDDGRYFNSKAEALAHISKLRQQGVTNIDVGCMQINLQFHGNQFQSAEEAIDPVHNVAYGASFLSELKARERSWTDAVKYYHSSDRQRQQRYRTKVYAYWSALRHGRDPAQALKRAPSQRQTPAANRQIPANTANPTNQIAALTAPPVPDALLAENNLDQEAETANQEIARIADRFRANPTPTGPQEAKQATAQVAPTADRMAQIKRFAGTARQNPATPADPAINTAAETAPQASSNSYRERLHRPTNYQEQQNLAARARAFVLQQPKKG